MDTIYLQEQYGQDIKLEDWIFYKWVYHEDDSMTWELLFPPEVA